MRHVQLAGRATLLLESCCTLILVVVPLGCNNLTPSPVPVPAAEPAAAEVTGDALRERLDRALELVYSRRRLNSRDHAAWQVVHGAVAFGRSFPLEKDGQLVGAVDYLLGGGELRGWNWEPGDLLNGRRGLRAIVEPGSQTGQGHYDQWLGYLAACDFPLEQPIRIGAEAYTLADLVAQVEWDVPRNVDREFSWTLMGLTKYRPTTHQWEASDGETWSIPQLGALRRNTT